MYDTTGKKNYFFIMFVQWFCKIFYKEDQFNISLYVLSTVEYIVKKTKPLLKLSFLKQQRKFPKKKML